jgi:hypothetical protein
MTCLKAKNSARMMESTINTTSHTGLLFLPQLTVKKTPKNTPIDLSSASSAIFIFNICLYFIFNVTA